MPIFILVGRFDCIEGDAGDIVGVFTSKDSGVNAFNAAKANGAGHNSYALEEWSPTEANPMVYYYRGERG